MDLNQNLCLQDPDFKLTIASLISVQLLLRNVKICSLPINIRFTKQRLKTFLWSYHDLNFYDSIVYGAAEIDKQKLL